MRRTMEARSWRWIWTLCSLLSIASLAAGSWGAPGSGQYHIQTDEGPERYFRFQTDNGQFRKEKRLQDGTVIGTEAWIDAAGFLRQKDYIADTKGYRILKSKTVFVGQGRPIEDAIKSTKAAPAQSGVLVDGSSGGVGVGAGANSIHPSAGGHKHAGYVYSTTTPLALPAATSTTPRPRPSSTATPTAAAVERAFGYLSPAEAAQLQPSPYLGFDHYPDELPARRQPARPQLQLQPRPLVHIRPHSQPIDHDAGPYDEPARQDGFRPSSTPSPLPSPSPSTPAPPSLAIEPPLPQGLRRRLRPVAVAAATPAPIAGHEATPAPAPAPGYFYAPQPQSPTRRPLDEDVDGPAHERGGAGGAGGGVFATSERPAPAVALPLDANNLEGLQPPPPPAYYRRPRPQRPQPGNNLDSAVGGDYDGVGTTRDGFRYFLPRQYHEEERVGPAHQAGSFGYVDPFGIRRVVYYNASPERGFVHRNSNHYVGLDAPPYDPRPY